MNGHVRVLVWHRAPARDPSAVEDAYHQISKALQGTPGLLRSELLRSEADPHALMVMSEWEGMEAFRAWEQGGSHRDTTAPLRPYQDRSRGQPYEIYEVTGTY